MAAFRIPTWFAKARRSKLSTRVTVLFAAALVVPWCAFAWLTIAERAHEVERTERTLAALASAYERHAALLMRPKLQGQAGETYAKPGLPLWTSQIDGELAAFRAALNAPGVAFSLLWPNAPPSDRGGLIVAEVRRDTGGIAAAASISEAETLEDWSARAYGQALALFIRSLFVVGIGWFLVRQLRWREAMERELVTARDRAQSANRAKTEFLANMGHELRTPLNAIIGFADIIKSRTFGPGSERYPEYAGDIYNSGTHLLGLINDILNLSKLEAGKFQLQEQEVDLALAVDACVRAMEAQARQSDIRLAVSLDPEARFVRADERRLSQILTNLLSNAVKFSHAGGEVRVTSARRSGALAISVRDAGIGMAPDDIPNALAPFGQIERKVRRKQEGAGLGLPLAKQFVELHGGAFAIESTLNVGTTVTFVLPPSRVIASPPARRRGERPADAVAPPVSS